MIPLLKNVDLQLMKSRIDLKQLKKKCLNVVIFNNLNANDSKHHLLISPYHPVPVNFKGSIIESSNCKKQLGIYKDSNFSFKNHINRICPKASQKLHVLPKTPKKISKNKSVYYLNLSNCHNSAIIQQLECATVEV